MIKKNIQDIFKVAVSNLALLSSGVLLGLLLPQIIGVKDYGYYKTYTLYAFYVGLFHFGFSDGIVLQYGGFVFNRLDKKLFVSYSRIFLFCELMFSFILAFSSIFISNCDLRFIVFMLSFNLLFHNTTSYFQSISQATFRFSELSARNAIQSFLISLTVLSLWFASSYYNTKITYRIFLICYTVIIIILSLWYVFTYRSIVWGDATPFSQSFPKAFYMVRIGFPLMLSNICSSLILTIDRQFVNVLFDIETYSYYAFAYNLLSIVTVITSAVSIVFYPNLKTSRYSLLKRNYSFFISLILSFMFGALILFFPLRSFINFFLPNYVSSLSFFKIIFPGLAINSAISIVIYNYFKVFKLSKLYFIRSVSVLIFSIIINLIVYLITKSPQMLSYASIVSFVLWYIMVDAFFSKRFKLVCIENYLYILFMIISFYSFSRLSFSYGFALYFFFYILFTFLFFYKKFKRSFFECIS